MKPIELLTSVIPSEEVTERYIYLRTRLEKNNKQQQLLKRIPKTEGLRLYLEQLILEKNYLLREIKQIEEN